MNLAEFQNKIIIRQEQIGDLVELKDGRLSVTTSFRNFFDEEKDKIDEIKCENLFLDFICENKFNILLFGILIKDKNVEITNYEKNQIIINEKEFDNIITKPISYYNFIYQPKTWEEAFLWAKIQYENKGYITNEIRPKTALEREKFEYNTYKNGKKRMLVMRIIDSCENYVLMDAITEVKMNRKTKQKIVLKSFLKYSFLTILPFIVFLLIYFFK